MLVSKKLKILGDVGIVDWFESDDDSVSIVVNGIAASYFEENTFLECQHYFVPRQSSIL